MNGSSQQAVVKTNDKKGSVCLVDVPKVPFSAIWDGYPSDGHPYKDVKTGKIPKGYENQCAIRVSAALHAAGVQMKSFQGATVQLKGKRAAIVATQLANWMKLMPFCGLPKVPTDATGKDWQDKIKGKTGIIYFENYWRRSGETGQGSGDHIDLWNKTSLTPSIESTMRFTLGIRTLPDFLSRLRGGQDNWYSDLGASSKILLWEIE